MLRSIPSKPHAHVATAHNEKNRLLASIGEILKQINDSRLNKASPFTLIEELKQLAIKNALQVPALLIYIQNCYPIMRPEVIATIDYMFIYNPMLLTELRPYEYELSLLAYQSNDPQFFDFIMGIIDSEVNSADMIFHIVKYKSMKLFEHISATYPFEITQDLIDKLEPHIEYLKKESYQLNNIVFFDWVYNLFGKQSEQGLILSRVCYSGGLVLLKHLIEVKKFSINSQMPDGSTALMSTIILLLSPMYAEQLTRRKEIINYLIDNGADLLVQRHDQRNAFHVAVQVDDTITLCALDAKLKSNRLKEMGLDQSQKSSIGSQLKTILYTGGETLLQIAIIHRAKKTIALLTRLFSEDIQDTNGLKIVCFALDVNRPEAAESLLIEFPSLNLRVADQNGINIFHRAAGDPQRIDSVKWLVDKKNFPLEETTIAGDTALLVATMNRNIVAIKYLIWDAKRKVNIFATNNTRNHIGHYLAVYDDTELLLKLISDSKYRLDYLAQNHKGENMLDKALSMGESHYPVVEACLLRIQGENKYIKKAAALAIRRKKFLPLYLRFLKHNKQNTAENDISRIGAWIFAGQTPQHLLAAELSVADMESYIQEFDLDINELNQSRQSIVCYLISLKKRTKAQNFISKFKPNVENVDGAGSSVLHIAVENNAPEFLTWCLNNLKLNILQKRNRNNVCPLDLAYYLNNSEISKILWSRLSETERLEYFFSSTQDKQDFVIQQLNYDPFNINGATLLHVAVRTENVELTSACLETKKFSILEKNKHDRSALDIAFNKRNSRIAKLLLSYLSEGEKFDYFLTANADKQEFLITQNIYDPNIEHQLDAIAEAIIQETIDEKINQSPSIYEESIVEEESYAEKKRKTDEYLIDSSVDSLIETVANELINESYQIENDKQIAAKQSLTSILTGVHSQLKSSVNKKETNKLAEDVANDLIDEALDNVFAIDVRISRAITERDCNFFRDLEDDDSMHELLSKHARNIIHQTISRGNLRFAKYILDIELISDHANFQHLTQAEHSNQKKIADILRTLPSVQQSIPQQKVQFNETESNGVLSKPECANNIFYAFVLEELAHELSQPEFQRLRALLYGGGNIKETPGDLDILFAEINSLELEDLVQSFIDKLVNTRGASLIVRTNSKNALGSPAKSPTSASFKVVPIEWLGCRIEFIITASTKEKHSQGLDYTINSMYYDIVAKQMYEVAGINARADFLSGTLNTIVPAEDSFKDLRRVFRGIRLKSQNPRFMFSQECFGAIAKIFSNSGNPFLANNMLVSHMFNQFADIYGPQHNKVANLLNLYLLNILPSAIDYLRKTRGKYNPRLADSLEREQRIINLSMTTPPAGYYHGASNLFMPHRSNFSKSNNKHQKKKTYAKALENGIFAKNGDSSDLNPQAKKYVNHSLKKSN